MISEGQVEGSCGAHAGDEVLVGGHGEAGVGVASVAFTLDTYAHAMPGQQKEAAAAVSALLENSVTNL